MTVTLVIGGQRSGKSVYAEALLDGAAAKLYVATGEAGDDEMAARIAAHRARRGADWTTAEAPLDVVAALAGADGRAVLVDCLSLWLANLLGAGRDVDRETDRLTAALASAAGDVVVVSSEVGLGIVPDNALARAYADALGTLNQRIARAAGRVVLVTAGLAHVLKDETTDT